MKIETEYIHLPSVAIFFGLFHFKMVSEEWQDMCVPSPPHNAKANNTKGRHRARVIWERLLCGTSYRLQVVGKPRQDQNEGVGENIDDC